MDAGLAEHGTGEGAGGSFAQARAHLTKEHWTLLWILGATSFFEGYDKGILIAALKQIRETYGLDESAMSAWLAVMFLGALPAIFVARKADVLGRRRVLLGTIVLYTIASGLTAVAPSIAVFSATQFVARLFLTAEQAIVVTFAAEQLPAKARGFGFGFLGMMLSLGFGSAALIFGIAEPVGEGWRWMYLVSVPPLLVVMALRRRLPESQRFEARAASGRGQRSWRDLFRPPHLRWIVLTGIVGLLIEMPTEALTFAVDFLQEEKGFSTSGANLALIVAGLPGIPAMLWAGSASDRWGRRRVGCAFMAVMAVGALLFFAVPLEGWSIVIFMGLATVGNMGSWPIIGGMAAELFPTSLRGQATSFSTSARVLGQAGSLALGSFLLHATDDNFGLTTTVLVAGVLVCIVLILVAFPDTHAQELESLSEDDDPDDPDDPGDAIDAAVAATTIGVVVDRPPVVATDDLSYSSTAQDAPDTNPSPPDEPRSSLDPDPGPNR